MTSEERTRKGNEMSPSPPQTNILDSPIGDEIMKIPPKIAFHSQSILSTWPTRPDPFCHCHPFLIFLDQCLKWVVCGVPLCDVY